MFIIIDILQAGKKAVVLNLTSLKTSLEIKFLSDYNIIILYFVLVNQDIMNVCQYLFISY
jgi:hypothetical protein